MVCQQQEMSKKHAKLRAEHEKLLEDAEHWKTGPIGLKGITQSRAIVMDKDQEEGKRLFVKVMICRKECCNKDFSEAG